MLLRLIVVTDGKPQLREFAVSYLFRVGELLSLAASVGKLTEMELGEGEQRLRCFGALSDFASHANGLLKAVGGERPLTLFQLPHPAQAVQVQLALIADPLLARRIERFRNVRKALRSTYDAVVKEPVPEHLLALLNQVDQAAERETPPAPEAPPIKKRAGAPVWAALAASILAGLMIGRAIVRRRDSSIED